MSKRVLKVGSNWGRCFWLLAYYTMALRVFSLPFPFSETAITKLQCSLQRPGSPLHPLARHMLLVGGTVNIVSTHASENKK